MIVTLNPLAFVLLVVLTLFTDCPRSSTVGTVIIMSSSGSQQQKPQQPQQQEQRFQGETRSGGLKDSGVAGTSLGGGSGGIGLFPSGGSMGGGTGGGIGGESSGPSDPQLAGTTAPKGWENTDASKR